MEQTDEGLLALENGSSSQLPDVLEASLEALRERAEEIAPYYEEYVQLREAVRSLEKIQEEGVPLPRRSRPRGTPGRKPFLEQSIIDALHGLGGGHHDVKAIYDKIRETNENVVMSSIQDKVQTMGREGVLDKPMRGRYRLPAIQEGE